MTVRNAQIAAVFDEIADLLELQGANPFRVRAYRNAARTLEAWPEEMAEWATQGRDFDALPGIGKDLAGKIGEILQRGTCAQLDRLRAQFPRGITDLLQVPGLGPRRVHALYHELGIRTPAQLLDAARAGRIRTLPGFGQASERRIAEAVAGHLERSTRWPIAHVASDVEALLAHLRAAPGVSEAMVAGSYRRRRDTVGDVDILVAAPPGHALADRLQSFDQVARVLAHGSTRASVVLRNGLQVDLRVVRPESFGAALVYFTGSKAHNIVLRGIARARRLKINEYGVYRTGGRGAGTRIAGETEASVYAAIGLPYIPPELREDHGEIEAAREGRLPVLVERADLRGDLHAHTDASDGHESLERMAQAAREAGLEYLAITDHSAGLKIAHGLDARRLLAQCEAIDRLNAGLRGITLLKGIEVEILPDGRLDLPDDVLARLDLVVGAVHSAFDLPRAKQTARILRAMDHPHFSILAHPNGRLFGTRGPCDVDMERIVRHARERGCALELNSQPERLDLFDLQCRMARDAGVPIAISSDAHRGADFRWLQYGVDQARRGWLEKGDVLNALPLGRLWKWLAATRTPGC
ncbi:DNA polymerase/3'-5' exonuclease PolX [Vulcaniibacterium gelatinicum]|uniref:DNA polymerase/3'-5' exonuclease PolX n=1 Tax=Vulcaniibacterium gelatinicum TaxID=2598725 RepID=UPI0011CC2489|nr:DNA polymerase/3'-5' exonuclease PolX [Vulcaniibacterium gelatinicum]